MKSKTPKIGLALGGGGARGISHIGVLKVLIKNKIPIDFITGASAGALVGAYYALNNEISGFEKISYDISKKRMISFIDPMNPKKALIKGDKIKKEISKSFENRSFNDVKIPLTIVATDLEKGKEIHIRKGDLAEAVRASISVPGIFYPVKIKNKWLVDGALINPTPVDVVKKMGADIVIAVDLTTSEEFKIKEPGMVNTLMQSFYILRSELTKLKLHSVKNQVVIRPVMRSISDKADGFRFNDVKHFIEQGEKAAEKALPEIRKKIKEFSSN